MTNDENTSVVPDVVEVGEPQSLAIVKDTHVELTAATTSALSDKAALSLEQKFNRLLCKSRPSKRQVIQKTCEDLYPTLEQHLAQGRPLKQVLAAFNELAGANVCVRTFNAMLAKERARRGAYVGLNICHACGQPLGRTNPESLLPNSSTSGSEESEVEQLP